MGIDPINRDRQYGLFVQIVGAPIIILGTLAIGIKELAVAIGSIFRFREREKLQNFKKRLQIGFKSYIELEIETAVTTLKTKNERYERCRAISTYQKDIKDLTFPEYKAKLSEQINEEMSLAVMNHRYKSVCHLIRCQPSIREKKTCNILSIDGGGIRAYLALVFLFELEIRLKRNICTMFDMVGGTGFGGLIAAALNISSIVNEKKPKYMTHELLNFFSKQ